MSFMPALPCHEKSREQSLANDIFGIDSDESYGIVYGASFNMNLYSTLLLFIKLLPDILSINPAQKVEHPNAI